MPRTPSPPPAPAPSSPQAGVRQRAVQARAEDSRGSLVDAAVTLFSQRGFDGVRLRDVCDLAKRPLGVLGYHFKSKDELWRAAAATIHGTIAAHFQRRFDGLAGVDAPTSARLILEDLIRYCAADPKLFRFMVQMAMADDERLRWYVGEYSVPFRERFGPMMAEVARQNGARTVEQFAVLLYTLLGAASFMHASAPEVRLTTGVDPAQRSNIDLHVALMVERFLPESVAPARARPRAPRAKGH